MHHDASPIVAAMLYELYFWNLRSEGDRARDRAPGGDGELLVGRRTAPRAPADAARVAEARP